MRRSPTTAGLVLIVIGLALYFFQGTTANHVIVFGLMGGLFLAAYFYERSYGYLVPGCILLGLGTGLMLEASAGGWVGEPVPFGLGLGFLAIFAVDQVYTRHSNWWPLIPGGVLVLIGVGAEADIVRWFFRRGWPLALVAVGFLLVARGLIGARASGATPVNGSEDLPGPPGESDPRPD